MPKQYLRIIGKKNTRRLILLLPVIFLGAFFETAGIALLISLVKITSGEGVRALPFISDLLQPLVEKNGLADVLMIVLFGLIYFDIMKAVYLIIENHLIEKFIRTCRYEASSRLYRKTVKGSYAYFIQHSTTEVENMLTHDANVFVGGLRSLMQFLQEFLVALSIGVFLLILNPIMTVFLMAGVLFLIILTSLGFSKRIQFAATEQSSASRSRLKWIQQAFGGIREVKIGRKEDFFCNRFQRADQRYSNSESSRSTWEKAPAILVEAILVASMLL